MPSSGIMAFLDWRHRCRPRVSLTASRLGHDVLSRAVVALTWEARVRRRFPHESFRLQTVDDPLPASLPCHCPGVFHTAAPLPAEPPQPRSPTRPCQVVHEVGKPPDADDVVIAHPLVEGLSPPGHSANLNHSEVRQGRSGLVIIYRLHSESPLLQAAESHPAKLQWQETTGRQRSVANGQGPVTPDRVVRHRPGSPRLRQRPVRARDRDRQGQTSFERACAHRVRPTSGRAWRGVGRMVRAGCGPVGAVLSWLAAGGAGRPTPLTRRMDVHACCA